MNKENSVITQKTRELCQAILDQPEFAAARRQIDAFMADEGAKAQYQAVIEKSEALQQKQNEGKMLEQSEIEDFEEHRNKLISNDVARGFLDAQQHMHHVQESVNRFVRRTFELGRLPQEEDLQSCGSGCNCSH